MHTLRQSLDNAPPASPDPTILDRIRTLQNGGRLPEAIRLAQAFVKKQPNEPAGHAGLGLVHLRAGQAANAIHCLQNAVRLAPNIATYHYHLGCALELVGRDAEAITSFQRALALSPDYLEALERLGNLLLTHGRQDDAVKCFRRIAATAPETLTGRLNRAKVLVKTDRPAEAEATLREILRLYPSAAEAHRFLATILREQGRFDEAIPLLEEATAGTATEAASAYHDLVLSQRIKSDDQPILDQMHALLRVKALPILYQSRVHFGLGKAYDDLGQYREAMHHFDAANKLASQGKAFDRAQFAVGINRLIDSFTVERFTTGQGVGSISERPVLIVGMPRSGTTLVEQILSSHSQVSGAGELTFWHQQAEAVARLGSIDLISEVPRIAAEYEALLAKIAPDASRVIDKMPGNFLWIGLIHQTFPRARIIHCRRHPVDTCLSNYFTNFTMAMPFTNNKSDLVFYYRWYEQLMNHWRNVLPTFCFMDIDYEELVTDPEPITRRLIDFLGLDWEDACLRPEANRRPVKTASMWQARQPTYRSSVERWRKYEPWLGELRQLLQSDEPPRAAHRPPEVMALLRKAAKSRASGQTEEAARLLAEAATLNPNDALMYNEVGLIYLQRHNWPAAVDAFERAVALEPDFSIAHYNLACALERCRRPNAAIAAYRKAIENAPELAEAQSRLGNLLHARGHREEALECFRRAADARPNATLGQLNKVKLLIEEDKAADAEVLLRQIVETDRTSSEAWRLLGNIYREAGRFADAACCLEQAIASDPAQVAAYHDLAYTRRMGEPDRQLIHRMESRLRQRDLTEFDQALLHFALGKCFDDLGLWAEAIDHFDVGNRLERGNVPFDRSSFASGVDRLIERFTKEIVAAGSISGHPSDLPLLVLGMPRSGTTLVEQIISSHPEISAGGELRFWNERAGAAIERLLNPSTLAALASEYLAELRRLAPAVARVTDKNPFNFLWIGLIHLVLPQARIIHCRRNPIDTCLSIYFTRFASRQEFAYDRGDLVFYYRQYERLMAHWRSILPADRFLEIDYETLIADQDSVTRRMIAFSGLEWNDACLAPERNPRIVKTASMWQARQPIYRNSVERWRRYEPWLGELRDLLPGEL